MKTAVIFHPRKDGDYSGFVFSEEWCQTAFLQFGYHLRGKYAGVQRDAIPWLWVSNRGEKHLCWHTILLAKYTRDLLYRGMGGTTGRNG